jgi:hypothetical protein
VALLAALTVAVGSAPGAASTAPKPCLIMERVLMKGEEPWPEEHHYAGFGGGSARCEWASAAPPDRPLQPNYQALLYVFHRRSAALAKAEYRFLATKCTPIRIRGADAACQQSEASEGGGSAMRIVWLRGSYYGWFAEAGRTWKLALKWTPRDLEEFLRGMPR